MIGYILLTVAVLAQNADAYSSQLMCFKVYNKRYMEKINTGLATTEVLCVNACFDLVSTGRTFTFALFGYNNVCYCSPSLIHQTLLTSKSCNTPCPANVTLNAQNCPAMISYTIIPFNGDAYPNDVGCFALSQTHKNNLKFPSNSTSMTQDMCVTKCLAIVSDLAVLGFGNVCFCSRNFDPKHTSTPSTNCNRNCVGNSIQNCGGDSEFRVLELGNSQPPIRYQGCYSNVVGETQPPMDTPNTVDQCILGCPTNYAAVSGSKCVCLSNLPSANKIDESMCNTTCPGNMVQNCGGTESQYSVFTQQIE